MPLNTKQIILEMFFAGSLLTSTEEIKSKHQSNNNNSNHFMAIIQFNLSAITPSWKLEHFYCLQCMPLLTATSAFRLWRC